MSESVHVVVRIRPENEKEKTRGGKMCITMQGPTSCEVDCTNQGFGKKPFTFDRMFDWESTQEQVYQSVGEPIVESVLKGYNGTLLAYGQTASGKTHTMMGPDGGNPEVLNMANSGSFAQRGLIPRTVAALFDRLQQLPPAEVSWTVRVSNFELYKEQIRDLLNPGALGVEYKIREDSITGRGIYVENLKEEEVRTVESILGVIQKGTINRKVAATEANDTSSRSHSIVQIMVDQINFVQGGTRTTSRLNLVDLAGSEKVAKTNAEGERLKEAQAINLSLTLLGQVIYKLTDGHSQHIPYRDSKLTRLLQDSLGGNSQTTLICACSPSTFNQAETLSTLQFAARAKQIKNKPKINKEMNIQELNIAYAKAQEEIRLLKDKISDLEAQSARATAQQQAGPLAGSGVKAVASLVASGRPQSGAGAGEDYRARIEELQELVRSLKEEIRELKQELLERVAEIQNLKQALDFYRAKHDDFEAKYLDMKEKYLREKKACESWMRKAQEQKQRPPPSLPDQANGTMQRSNSAVRRDSLRSSDGPKRKPAPKKPRVKKAPVKGGGGDAKEKEAQPPGISSSSTAGAEEEEEAEMPETPSSSAAATPHATEEGPNNATNTGDGDGALLEAFEALRRAEADAQAKIEELQSKLEATTQRLQHAERQNQDYGMQKAMYVAELEAKTLQLDKALKEMDALRRAGETKDGQISELEREIAQLRREIAESNLTAEQKAKLLGSRLQSAEDAYRNLTAEHSHISALAKQLGREANQREICEIVSIDLMVKGEDLTALENDVYLLELFETASGDADDHAQVTRRNTRATLKELNSYLVFVRDLLSKEPFSNPSTESQRLTLLFSLEEMTGKTDELTRRLQMLDGQPGWR
eukprot:TRINITY_DN93857_c0_g1_i2.p1 TRINITY_DN93857_c0_g1~~TRINITY_DN93857_c0_g1_i2.p1  ORF type:complete len:874 (-),score=227.08 TRINITY_DN93857_c0_g1_i2:74-2695(-)